MSAIADLLCFVAFMCYILFYFGGGLLFDLLGMYPLTYCFPFYSVLPNL